LPWERYIMAQVSSRRMRGWGSRAKFVDGYNPVNAA
jgi:hypothetical protein